MIEQRVLLPDINISNVKPDFKEAYLEFYGLNHFRPSYTAWLFFSDKLPKKVSTNSRGFAGALYLFGHDECWGDSGHCHGTDGSRRFDSRPSHPMTRAFKRIPVSKALKRQIDTGNSDLKLSIFAFSRCEWKDQNERSLMCCTGIQLVTK